MALSDIPTPRSQQQALGEMLDSFTSRSGIRKLKIGNPILSILESVSLSTTKSTYDAFKALNAQDLDHVDGVALQAAGNDKKLTRRNPVAAQTIVTITDSSFTKISSNVYHGTPAPIVGTQTINVAKTPTFDAAPSSGTVYIGRGTSRAEGPLSYTSKTDNTNYWTLALSSPTAAFHNQGESVIVGQGGDRTINSGLLVSTSSTGLSDPIRYSVLVGGILADGETELNNILVKCTTPGARGNVPQNTIKEFVSSPFNGASVTNPNVVTSGRDLETVQEFRDRIKAVENSKTKGTSLAIKTAVWDLSAPDEDKTVLSAATQTRYQRPSYLYIDDGNGYEPISNGVGYEVLRSNASGGETEFITLNRPIVQASIETSSEGPWYIESGQSLIVTTGGNTEVHYFDTSVFNDPLVATPYEICNSINANGLLSFQARVSGNGTKVTLYPKNDTINSIQVRGGFANDTLQFPTSKAYTALLFKNDRLLDFTAYNLNRATGNLALINYLNAGDSLSLGSLWSKGFVESSKITNFSLSSDQNLWFVVDGNTTIVDTAGNGVGTLTVSVHKATTSSLQLLIQNSSNFNSNVSIGHNLLLYPTNNNVLPTALEGVYKIIDKPAANQVVIEYSQMKAARKQAACANFTYNGNKVLVCGGQCSYGSGALNTAEIYDSDNKTWSSAANMNAYRHGHTATTLPNGKVLVVGGLNENGAALNTAELYDPATNTWTLTATMPSSRYLHSALLLLNNNVLVAGGLTGSSPDWTTQNTSVEYNYTTNTWENSATFSEARCAQSLIALPGNKAFMVGGLTEGPDLLNEDISEFSNDKKFTVTQVVNIYDEASHSWSTAASVPAIGAPGDVATAYRNYSAGLATSDIVVATMDHYYFTYSISGDAWTSRGLIDTTAWLTIKNGTSISNQTATEALAYSSIGRANPLVRTTNGTVILPFGEFSNGNGPQTYKGCYHLKYDTGTNAWVKFASPNSNSHSPALSLWCGAPNMTNSNEVLIFGGIQGTIGHITSREAYGAEIPVSSGVETINSSTGTSYSCPVTGTFTGVQGWVVYNTTAPTVKNNIPAGVDYIAPGLVNILDIDGATAKTYKNSYVRISTNDNVGDITLVGPTIQNLTQEVLEASAPTTNATIKSVASDVSTPYDFRLFQVGQVDSDTITIPCQQIPAIGTPAAFGGYLPLNGTIKGLYKKNIWEDGVAGPLYNWPTNTQDSSNKGFELGNFKNEVARIGSRSLIGSFAIDANNTTPDSTVVTLFDNSVKLTPNQAIYCGSPFFFGYKDKLSVIVDQDTFTGRFVIPMARKVKSANANYASLLTLVDAENSNQSLARLFGIDYKFDNFFVAMKARNKLGNILYRFYRPGAEGENYTVKYEYANSANAPVAINIDHKWLHYGDNYAGGIQKSKIGITLPTSDEYTETTLTPTSRLGVIQRNFDSDTRVADCYIVAGFSVIEAERINIGGTTRLKIQLPDSSLNVISWFNEGDYIRFDALNQTPTTLLSGQTRVTSVGVSSGSTIDIYIAALSLDDGTAAMATAPNPGWVSLDPSASAIVQFDNNVVLNDLVVLNLPGTTATSLSLNDRGFRITELHDHFQWMKIKINNPEYSTFSYYNDIPNTNIIKLIASSTITETSMVSAINALEGVVSATLIDTSTSITQATWDSLDHWDGGIALTDGLNAVLSTINPLSTSSNYQINLKKGVNSNLVSSSDFINEEIYLIPGYAKDVVKWLNTSCITGLWSLADVVTADSGTSIQISSKTSGRTSSIQISGVGANETASPIIGSSPIVYPGIPTSRPNFIVTIDTANAEGFVGGSMVKIENTNPVQKLYGQQPTLVLNSIAANGTLTFNQPPYTAGTTVTTPGSIEKVGDFAVIRLASKPGDCWDNEYGTGTYPDDYIYIAAPSDGVTSLLSDVSNSNKGVYRIVNISHNNCVIWIENASAVTEKSLMDVTFLTSKSLVPGDIITIADDAFGIPNKGSWTITDVGNSFTDNTLTLDISNRALTALNTAQNMTSSSVQVLDGTPRVFYKKLLGINPNTNPDYTDLVLCNPSNFVNPYTAIEVSAISEDAGSVISSMNKLNFDTALQVGIDAYRYNTGLIGEANKVLYGSEDDPETYPGVVSDGACVLIDGPLIKSIKLGFSVKIVGNPSDDLSDQIKAAIAGVINSNKVGQDLIISDMISAGGAVDNVISITALYTDDIIKVSANEKTMVLNLNDISVIFST